MYRDVDPRSTDESVTLLAAEGRDLTTLAQYPPRSHATHSRAISTCRGASPASASMSTVGSTR